MRPIPAHPDDARRPSSASLLGQGESPLWWGIPLGSIRGVRIRVHLVLPTFVLARLAYALWMGEGIAYVTSALFGLLLAVAVHEAARATVIARSRRLRGAEACLWPAGAIWRTEGEADPRLEGRGASAALKGILALALAAALAFWWATGRPELLLFNPLNPSLTVGEVVGGSTPTTLLLMTLWQVYAVSLYLVAANLLPAMPLDGGLVLRASLSRDRSPRAATETAARVGMAAAFLLFIGAMVLQATTAAALAACCATVCWLERQSALFAMDPATLDRWRVPADESPSGGETTGPTGPITPEERERMERVLEKISRSGVASLTRSERRTLAEATAKLRAG